MVALPDHAVFGFRFVHLQTASRLPDNIFRMKSLLLLVFLITFSFKGLFSQNILYDDTRISDVYVELPADSLTWIMANVLSDHYFRAMFIYDYGTGRDTIQNIGFRLRGNTSRVSKKKSFKISFNEYVSGRRYQDVKKMNLNGQHNDPTLIREKLFYDSWYKAGLPERRTSFVRLYINHSYYGLYTNLEEFDKDWLQKVFGEKSGNLYKCTWPADLVYLGTDQQTYKNINSGSVTGGRAYDLQTNEIADDYSGLVDLITLLNQTPDAAFAALIAQKINIDGLLKAFALDVASGNWDDYMYNKNNYFLYQRSDNGKFEFITYDTDNTFGVDWVNRDWATRNCLDWLPSGQSRPLAEKILAVPEFNAKYQRYLDTIARQIINPEFIFPHIDSLKSLIYNAAIADTYRSLDYGYTIADFNNGFIQTVDGHTPYGIKPFLSKRSTTILQQLPTTSVAENTEPNLRVLLYPNPAEDYINVKVSAAKYAGQGFITDILGRQIKTFALSGNKEEFSVLISDLYPGVYTLSIQMNEGYISTRFIKK